jgi:hypothetical protein
MRKMTTFLSDSFVSLCHKSVMKHASIIACVLAASVMPTAYAEQAGDNLAPKAYEIKVQGDVTPTNIMELDYPYASGVKSRSGSCDLSVSLDSMGNIGAVSVDTCSSEDFAAEAGKLARGSETLEVASSHPLRIEWTIE